MAKAILLADDSQDDATLFKRVVGKARLANPLFIVSDGAEAIAYLNGEGAFADREKYPLPAILFLDLKMPRIYGQEVLRWLQSQPHLSEMLLIVVSHFDDAKTFAAAYALGAKTCLTKPLTQIDLGNLIQNYPGYWERSAVD